MSRLLYMGINGSILITAVICFRHFFSHLVPKRFLVFLWICAIARLLLPVAVPVSLPADRCWNIAGISNIQQFDTDILYDSPDTAYPADENAKNFISTPKKASQTGIQIKKFLFVLWFAAAVWLAVKIAVKHIRCCRLYHMSLPVYEKRAAKWLQTHHTFRKITIRKSDLIKSPLTYGVIRPVILLPSKLRLNEEEFLCIMEHEWIHIRRADVLVKYLSYLTVCIYWFHPLVWIMSVLLERDLEMACDEEVVKNYSGSMKKTYALTLIRLAKGQRNSVFPINACFTRHSELEERMIAIMKPKKYSWKAAALAAGMLCCTIPAFTAFAQESYKETAVDSENTAPDNTDTDDIQSDSAGQTAADTQSDSAGQTAADTQSDSAGQTAADTQSDSAGQTAAAASFEAGKKTGIREQITALAKKYTGAPYKSGGTDLSSGTDSPGFIKAIYGLAGIELPADLSELAASGTEISPAELSAGDIVIYSDADGDQRLFHAAIYDGSGQVIHASNMKDGVKISDLNYRKISMCVTIQITH